MNVVDEIIMLLNEKGDSQYGREAVTQKEHALQAAWSAEQAGADSALITAALLHDIGHLLHDLPDDAPSHGVDDLHEQLGHKWLRNHYGPAVTEPVRLHVDAKRYLCAVDPDYFATLSPPSVQSLALQGGPFTPDEVRAFEQGEHHQRAVRLRHWDDTAKVPDLKTPDPDHFRPHLQAALNVQP